MKLLSWNIQWCRGADMRVDARRIAREIRHLADADVICLQEVARGFDALAGSRGDDQFALLAQAFPGYTAVEGIAVDVAGEPGEAGARHQFGNLLLSRLPVRRVWRHLLPWPADPVHADMQRVAIEAVIESPMVGPLRVTTTHLAYYSPAQRAAQVETLRQLHAAAQGHQLPPAQADASRGPFHWMGQPGAGIVTGDFNCEPESADHARMLQPIAGAPAFRDAWQLAHGAAPHAHTVGLFDTVQWPRRFCCDFVFVSEDLAHGLRASRSTS